MKKHEPTDSREGAAADLLVVSLPRIFPGYKHKTHGPLSPISSSAYIQICSLSHLKTCVSECKCSWKLQQQMNKYLHETSWWMRPTVVKIRTEFFHRNWLTCADGGHAHHHAADNRSHLHPVQCRVKDSAPFCSLSLSLCLFTVSSVDTHSSSLLSPSFPFLSRTHCICFFLIYKTSLLSFIPFLVVTLQWRKNTRLIFVL